MKRKYNDMKMEKKNHSTQERTKHVIDLLKRRYRFIQTRLIHLLSTSYLYTESLLIKWPFLIVFSYGFTLSCFAHISFNLCGAKTRHAIQTAQSIYKRTVCMLVRLLNKIYTHSGRIWMFFPPQNYRTEWMNTKFIV